MLEVVPGNQSVLSILLKETTTKKKQLQRIHIFLGIITSKELTQVTKTADEAGVARTLEVTLS